MSDNITFNSNFGYSDIFKIIGFICAISLAYAGLDKQDALINARIDALNKRVELSKDSSQMRLNRIEAKLDKIIFQIDKD